MGILAAVRQLAYGFLVAFNWVCASLFRHTKLHAARFARIDELASLTVGAPEKEGSGLILGVSHLKSVLRVKPTRARRELGNLLVVAPATAMTLSTAATQRTSFSRARHIFSSSPMRETGRFSPKEQPSC